MKFKHRLLQEASEFDDIRLVFDQYLNCSLKEQCRRQIQYIIMDSAPLEGITLKYFLSHNETKSDLTTYLPEYCVKSLKKHKKFVVVYQTSCVTNICPDLKYHNHEEADILIMLQAKNVADIYPNCEIYIITRHRYFYLPFTFPERCLQN